LNGRSTQLPDTPAVPSTDGCQRRLRAGQGVNSAGAGVGWIIGIQLAFVDQTEAGLFQRATRRVVGGLRDGHDRGDLWIEAEDVRYEAGDRGGPEASPALRGFADQIVNAG